MYAASEETHASAMTRKRQLALIRKLCGLGLPAQTLAPSLLPALRTLIPSHSAAVFWVDDRFEMTGLYAERLLPPTEMAAYYEKHYQDAATGFPNAFRARVAASDPVSVRKLSRCVAASGAFSVALGIPLIVAMIFIVAAEALVPTGAGPQPVELVMRARRSLARSRR